MQIITGREPIRRYQLRVVIAAIKLEARGVAVVRGSAKAAWARKFGLSPRSRPEDVIARLEREIKESYEREQISICCSCGSEFTGADQEFCATCLDLPQNHPHEFNEEEEQPGFCRCGEPKDHKLHIKE